MRFSGNSQLKTPTGQLAGQIDRVMLLALWSNVLQNHPIAPRNIIAAGMGKPTFPLHPDLLTVVIDEAQCIRDKALRARAFLESDALRPEQIRIALGKQNAVIGYDNPQGKLNARIEAAKALSIWYKTDITADNILFTTGGAGALFDIFTWLNHKNPDGYIVTPFPFYSLYSTINYGMNRLHPVHVMREKGYKLTANALSASIAKAKEKGRTINAFLFCDPNNPLGTVVSKEGWAKIAAVLKTVPDVPIIFDGAYAEMVFNPNNRTSLLEVADSEIKNRIILLRSGTKALSVPGLRMALAIVFDPQIMARLIQTNIDTSGHPATLIQDAFAKMLALLNEPSETNHFIKHYAPQVEWVYKKLRDIGAALPDLSYKPDGTFYIVGDFSDLLGTELHKEAWVAVGEKSFIMTDEDLCYDLLFRNNVMIAPMSYYGLNGHTQAYMRITCSGGDDELKALMDILGERLLQARQSKISAVGQRIMALLGQLQNIPAADKISIVTEEELKSILETKYNDALSAKEALEKLKSLELNLKEQLVNDPILLENNAAQRIQSAYNLYTTRKLLSSEWKNFVNQEYPRSKNRLQNLSSVERIDYFEKGWKEHLNNTPKTPMKTSKLSLGTLP